MAHHLDVNRCLLHNLIFFFGKIYRSVKVTHILTWLYQNILEKLTVTFTSFANINQDKGRGDGHYLEKRLHRWFKYISMD